MNQQDKQYVELWNEICFILSENVKPEINEAAFQREVIRVLEKLGWRQYKKEFFEQVPIPSGTSTKYADIIVQSAETGLPHFVIEIKRPQEDSTEQKTAGQLLSYMRFKKCEIGVIIGNIITVIWDDRQSSTADYIVLVQIPFCPSNNTAGIEFSRVFSKDNFTNVEIIQNYITEKVYTIQQKKAYDDVKQKIISSEFYSKIINFLRGEIGNTLNAELTNNLLNEIDVVISYKNSKILSQSTSINDKITSGRTGSTLQAKSISNTKDYTQYNFNGAIYGKGRLVLAIIAKYVEDHPNTSYAMLENVFPKYLQGSHCVFAKVEDAINSGKRDKIRFFIKENELINLRDSVIAVSTEWGISNIGKLIQAANSMGYGITAIEA